MTFSQSITEQVEQALKEDLNGDIALERDITAQLIDINTVAMAEVITREDCVICGVTWVNEVFKQIDSTINVKWLTKDGDKVSANTTLFTVSGNARTLLIAERTALNFLQTLSGTATTTASYTTLLEGSSSKLLDTRKTIPGLRLAQKYAVTCGGGHNHRMGLFDAFLIKENHIHACGGIEEAIAQARVLFPEKSLEIEVENLEQLQKAINANADIVMLDNFTTDQIVSAVSLNAGRCKLEVSGNITQERLQELAQTGVDYISSGALTKNVRAIDLSLRIVSSS